MSEDHLVSVVIPAFNCMNTIEAAVRSCLEQTHSSVEIIVVNDGSTDGTRDILGRLGSSIRVIDQVNGGLASARNAGQRRARGQFIAWMDGDDLARPERLQTQLAALRAVPEAQLACSDFSSFDDPAEDLDLSYIRNYYGVVRQLGGIDAVFPNKKIIQTGAGNGPVTVRWSNVYDVMLAGNCVHPPTVLARRDLLERLGEFDASLRYSSDYDFLLRASRVAPFAFVDAPLLRYRRSAEQMSRAGASGKMQLETVRILEKARRADPTVDARRGDDLRRFAAEALLSAAEGFARAGDRIEALRLVRMAQSHRFLPRASIRALARIALPNSGVDVVRSLRRKLRHAVTCSVLDFPEAEGILGAALPLLA